MSDLIKKKELENFQVCMWIRCYTYTVYCCYITSFWTITLRITGMIFFQLFNWLQLFSSYFFPWTFKRGCRCFQLFFIDFQLFYFLLRIIPGINKGGNISRKKFTHKLHDFLLIWTLKFCRDKWGWLINTG